MVPYRVVRWGFAVLVLLFPLQAAFAILIAEPYPALTQPGFGSVPESSGHVTVEGLEIVAYFEDGTREELDEHELFEDVTGISVRFASRLVFDPDHGEPDPRTRRGEVALGLLTPPWYDPPQDRARHPETVAWLRGRLAELSPGREPRRVVFRWLDVTHPATDADEIVAEEVVEETEVVL